MNDAKRALRIQDLRAAGADGLVVPGECGCGLGDFAPCGDGPYPECVAARALIVPAEGTIRCPEAEPGNTIYVPLTSET